MSRRRGEFEHRTSIFEGAFRAWSHLGGLDPEDLESKPATDLDPLSSPVLDDKRDVSTGESAFNIDGSKRRLFPYEPLPRSGLAHPYVQAILSPWLGPDADHDAIQLGLTTLRTWWQHRRKGESGSAIAALGTDKMRGVVEGYTRHFFNLAHCLVVNDKEQPPRSLHGKMKELEKVRNKRNKKRAREEQAGKLAALALNAGIAHGFHPKAGDDNKDAANNPAGANANAASSPEDVLSKMSPLERLHAAQRRQLAESGGVGMNNPNDINSVPLIHMKGKCIPGKIDIPAAVNAISLHSSQLAHRGGANPNTVTSSNNSGNNNKEYGDPNSTPVVFVSHNGDIQLAMSVEGITCAHCVKIVETVLKGCNGNKSPIDGLLDAAADRVLCKVLIKIDKSSNAKRVAFEAARNLAMVGYTAKAKDMSIVDFIAKKGDLESLSAAFDVVANTHPKDVFDWNISCTCPDNGILRDDCSRHSQMNTSIFAAFDSREEQVSEFMAGCGQKYGMACTCGPDCRCSNCSEHCKQSNHNHAHHAVQNHHHNLQHNPLSNSINSQLTQEMGNISHNNKHSNNVNHNSILEPLQVHEDLHEPLNYNEDPVVDDDDDIYNPMPMNMGTNDSRGNNNNGDMNPPNQRVQRRSILSFPGRQMSITSENTFGRAMSGLSALSIDWENMEDFDVNVDHSAHIQNINNADHMSTSTNLSVATPPTGFRRSSFRRSFRSTGSNASATQREEENGGGHSVTFKV
mmetsp:Transcript_28280/g.41777  ORF Transcript_28280/g.41777 Transcript_28280/m.41777 type:complete len:742 (+) Transcript_28280:500-2725(+)